MKVFATKQYILARLEQEGLTKEASSCRDALQKEAVMDESRLNRLLRMDVGELPSAIVEKIIGWFSGGEVQEEALTKEQKVARALKELLAKPEVKSLDDARRRAFINKFFKDKNIEHMKFPVLRILGLVGK